MKKQLASIFIIACLLPIGIVYSQAFYGYEPVVVSYERTQFLQIVGEKEVMKGTANHIYKSFIADIQVDVMWSIKGAASKNTCIDENGTLRVGVDETANYIEIFAISKENTNMYVSMKVTLFEKTYTLLHVEKKSDITIKYGITENELSKRLSDYAIFQVTIQTNEDKVYTIEVKQATFHSELTIIKGFNLVDTGSYDVIYELILPYIKIEYDGVLTSDIHRETNIIGDANTSIKVIILETEKIVQLVNPESTSTKLIKGTHTGVRNHVMWYIVIGIVSLCASYVLWKKRKR